MNNIEKEIVKYFEETEVPELPAEELNKLKQKLANQPVQKPLKHNRITIFRRITAVACAICLLLVGVIPTIAYFYKDEPIIYYGNNEATRVDLSVETTQEIISANYPKYNFMFDDFSFNLITGYYVPNDNTKLLAIEIKAHDLELEIELEINLVVSKQFVFSQQEKYIKDIECNKTNPEYDLYYKETNSLINKNTKAYFIYSNYELYVSYNKINDTLFNKFA